MEIKTYISFLLLLLLHFTALAQVSIERQVIGSAGSTGNLGWGTIDYTVGECIITTATSTNIVLTQGFQQPDESRSCINISRTICKDVNGKINFTFHLSSTDYPIYVNVTVTNPGSSIPLSSYTDSVNGPQDLTNNEISFVPNINLSITVHNTCDSITYPNINANNIDDCTNLLTFYNGITPNGDNINDVWWIDGIEFSKENYVAIFNRWGDKVWDANGYNNKEIVWEGKSNGGKPLPDATYFYFVKVGKNVYKGWVELTQ